MKTQITIQIESSEPEVFPKTGNDYYKECPYCGQNWIPFKKGVCICGKQVGNIRYVNKPEKFAKKYYSYIITPKTEKLGIQELMDN